MNEQSTVLVAEQGLDSERPTRVGERDRAADRAVERHVGQFGAQFAIETRRIAVQRRHLVALRLSRRIQLRCRTLEELRVAVSSNPCSVRTSTKKKKTSHHNTKRPWWRPPLRVSFAAFRVAAPIPAVA